MHLSANSTPVLIRHGSWFTEVDMLQYTSLFSFSFYRLYSHQSSLTPSHDQPPLAGELGYHGPRHAATPPIRDCGCYLQPLKHVHENLRCCRLFVQPAANLLLQLHQQRSMQWAPAAIIFLWLGPDVALLQAARLDLPLQHLHVHLHTYNRRGQKDLEAGGGGGFGSITQPGRWWRCSIWIRSRMPVGRLGRGRNARTGENFR